MTVYYVLLVGDCGGFAATIPHPNEHSKPLVISTTGRNPISLPDTNDKKNLIYSSIGYENLHQPKIQNNLEFYTFEKKLNRNETR